jgi:hypothetical protein
MNPAQPKQTPAPLPRYVRPPARGPEYFSRFSRSKLYQLERDGHIRGISLHEKPGQKQGIKLFDLQSILDYVERRARTVPNKSNNQIRK